MFMFSQDYIQVCAYICASEVRTALWDWGIKGIHKPFFIKSKDGYHSKYWWNKIQNAIKTNLMKPFCQLDEKCFKWCFNLVLSLPGSRIIAVNCPSPSSGCLGMAHLWCMDFIFREAGALTHGACGIELSCLKRLLSPALPPDSLQAVWQKNWWQCQENAEAWVMGVLGLGWWFVLWNGTSGSVVSWRQASSAAATKSWRKHKLEPTDRLHCLKSQYWWRSLFQICLFPLPL